MSEDSYPNMCIFHTLDGLRDGLSHFSEPSRVALIYAVRSGDPIRVYDPQKLLQGHEPILKELYLDSDELSWQDLFHAVDVRIRFFTRFGLPNTTRTYARQVPPNAGLSMQPGCFHTTLLPTINSAPVLPVTSCENTPPMRCEIILSMN